MNDQTRLLRNAFGSFATGIAIVTANSSQRGSFGITINSLSSLSLEPPLLLWSLQKNSECLNDFINCDYFGINILNSQQKNISTMLATQGSHKLSDYSEIGWYTSTKTGCPLIENCLGYFECSLSEQHDGGDHIIIIGKVEAFNCCEEGAPLIFYNGSYCALHRDDKL